VALYPIALKANGRFAKVAMTASVEKEFDGLGLAVRARLQATIEAYAQDGPTYLSKAKFRKNEGRHSMKDGTGANALVAAFAHNEAGIRIYGSLQIFRGQKTFLCTEVDVNKKQRKANQEKLQRSAENIGRILSDERKEQKEGGTR